MLTLANVSSAADTCNALEFVVYDFVMVCKLWLGFVFVHCLLEAGPPVARRPSTCRTNEQCDTPAGCAAC